MVTNYNIYNFAEKTPVVFEIQEKENNINTSVAFVRMGVEDQIY